MITIWWKLQPSTSKHRGKWWLKVLAVWRHDLDMTRDDLPAADGVVSVLKAVQKSGGCGKISYLPVRVSHPPNLFHLSEWNIIPFSWSGLKSIEKWCLLVNAQSLAFFAGCARTGKGSIAWPRTAYAQELGSPTAGGICKAGPAECMCLCETRSVPCRQHIQACVSPCCSALASGPEPKRSKSVDATECWCCESNPWQQVWSDHAGCKAGQRVCSSDVWNVRTLPMWKGKCIALWLLVLHLGSLSGSFCDIQINRYRGTFITHHFSIEKCSLFLGPGAPAFLSELPQGPQWFRSDPA